MKKTISVCLCICLMSGCDKSLRHGRPVNAVTEDKAPHSLPSDASNIPAPTPEPSKSALPASGNVDTGSSVIRIGLCVVALFLCFWYLSRSRLLSPKFVLIEDYTMSDEYLVVPFEEIKSQGYRVCYLIRECISFYSWYIFDRGLFRNFYRDIETGEEVKGIPIFTNCVDEDKVEKYGIDYSYLYRPEPVT